jgi:2-amino-4-hydroxy-6-hydroxymethyldihydropteridine diphosphokinase
MTKAYLGLGSNLGDRQANLEKALSLLDAKILRISSFYETEPMYVTDQPAFLNMAVEIETEMLPRDLLEHILSIEQTMGRIRTLNKGPRNIDIDLLLYGNEIIDEPGLVIPHPAIADRKFVLDPLSEIAPDLVHPVTKRKISQERPGSP